jgi:RNA polymerase sigma-70 factor (ECF subfamily)
MPTESRQLSCDAIVLQGEDTDLVTRMKQGDARAFEAILEKYERAVFNVAYRTVQDYDDAADITQTVFLKAYERARSYDPRYKFFSWLYRIAVNESLNYLKRRRREVQLEGELADLSTDPDVRVAQDEQSERIQKALMDLTPDYRVVVVLRYFLEMSYREIGEIVGIREKTVKSRLFSARQRLRTILTHQGA